MSQRVKLTTTQLSNRIKHLQRILELRCTAAVRSGHATEAEIADIHRTVDERDHATRIGDKIKLDGLWYRIDDLVVDGVILSRVRSPQDVNKHLTMWN